MKHKIIAHLQELTEAWKRTIRATARKFDIPTGQCREDMQAAIDEAWATADPAAQAFQKQLFPAGKPTVEEFISVLGKRLKEGQP